MVIYNIRFLNYSIISQLGNRYFYFEGRETYATRARDSKNESNPAVTKPKIVGRPRKRVAKVLSLENSDATSGKVKPSEVQFDTKTKEGIMNRVKAYQIARIFKNLNLVRYILDMSTKPIYSNPTIQNISIWVRWSRSIYRIVIIIYHVLINLGFISFLLWLFISIYKAVGSFLSLLLSAPSHKLSMFIPNIKSMFSF
uniref:Uncharacterized protein n=1 Tax=Treubia lacunosa TaxID=93845 RepID=G4Y9V9_9MARC|nr:hypothetical protein TrlaMp61 [Treubia lacunosa]AEH99756.1 hypothetical protein TrlaMp61 [Treubia lacunosa]